MGYEQDWANTNIWKRPTTELPLRPGSGCADTSAVDRFPAYRRRWIELLLVFLLGSATTSAATLRLSGVVLPSKRLEVTALAPTKAISMETGGSVVLASIREKSNNTDGYKVTLTSQTEAAVAARVTSEKTDSSDSDSNSTTPLPELPTVRLDPVLIGREGTTKNLVLNIPAGQFSRSDSYSDTLTITLIAN